MATTTLSPEEVAALHEALEDEYKAWATYDQVIRDFGAVRPFINIRESEARHIAALSALFARHGLPLPQNAWPGKVRRFESLRAACQAGVDGEIENERLYERLLGAARHADVRAVFERLRDASRLRHLPAFRRCVAREAASAAEGPRRRRRRGEA
jgi:hypothetical protein